MSTFVVIPSCREVSIGRFITSTDFDNLIVVEDNDHKTFSLPRDVQHYSHEEIKKDLGDKAWIIPRKNASVRSYGFYKAWQQGADYIITLDDDCEPVPSFIKDHINALDSPSDSAAWTNTIKGVKARGVPFYAVDRSNETLINHGLWNGNYDYDAVTQLTAQGSPELISQVIEKGRFYPMCGMNIAFKAKAVPMMYFLLMGPDYPYDRLDDIWAGLFSKKICDHLNYGVKSGEPYVLHIRASNVWENLKKESSGYAINEDLWRYVDKVVLTEDTISGCYRQIADEISGINGYFAKLSEAMKIWVSLYEKV